MSRFKDNLAFVSDESKAREILDFQMMKGGHIFHAENLHRFAGFMAFDLNSPRVKSKRTLSLLANSTLVYVSEIITHKRYIFWLVWNHVGYLSWRSQSMTNSMTTADPARMPSIPSHISSSIALRYGKFVYCRYFEYAARARFVVYWVVLEESGQVLIVEQGDGRLGALSRFIDVTFSRP